MSFEGPFQVKLFCDSMILGFYEGDCCSGKGVDKGKVKGM